uniref:Uncharacterized protein n=1 Tax=Cacopsylla melanoneura TaxID=428564 RepID=A0A8D8RBE8_9HEMI
MKFLKNKLSFFDLWVSINQNFSHVSLKYDILKLIHPTTTKKYLNRVYKQTKQSILLTKFLFIVYRVIHSVWITLSYPEGLKYYTSVKHKKGVGKKLTHIIIDIVEKSLLGR